MQQDKKLLTFLQSVLEEDGGTRGYARSKAVPVHFLDIGCGTGEALAAARDLGWTALGTDISKPAIDFARTRWGIDAREGSLNKISFPGEMFDIVLLRETLEHLAEPFEVIGEIFRITRPHGLLYVQVPNDLAGYRAKLFRKAWHVIPPLHLYYFSTTTLTAALVKHGFVPIRSGTISGLGRDIERYLLWRLGLLSVIDRFYYRPGFNFVVRALGRAMAEVFSPFDLLMEHTGLGSSLWVCARKI